MNKPLQKRLQRVPWLAYALAGLGALIYALQTWRLAYRLTTMILDESMYVYKGWLFVSGRYGAYQDFGPLTNHMPLSFIIPGWVQAAFGPGMETARVFAFIVGLVMLAGFWMAAFRLGGKWWGAAMVWILVLTPAWQQVFSQGLTQGLVNALLTWGLVLLIGKERKGWQLALSAAILALAVMVRVNMLPVLGLVVLYVFWQHGWRKGLAAAAGGALVGVTVLALFWPDVLKFLAGWIPEGLLGFVEPYRSPWSQQHVPDGFGYFPLRTWWGDADALQWGGVRAFFEAINFNFIPFLAVFGTLILWPPKAEWKDRSRTRLVVLLLAAWLLMAGMHIWVALSGKSCRFFCLAGYFTFFNFLALLLLPTALPVWRWKRLPWWRGILGFLIIFGLTAAALFTGGYRPKWVFFRWYRWMHTPVPRVSNGKILWDERGQLLSLLENKLKLDYAFLIEELPGYLYWAFLVLLVFGLFPLIARLSRKWTTSRMPVVRFIFIMLIVLGLGLGYSGLFYGETAVLACNDSVIESHETVAAELAGMIEPDAALFWDLTSNMLLLYLPEVEIYPPQLNTSFNFVAESDPAESTEIYRFGYWDDYLRTEWIKQADYLLIPGQHIRDWEKSIQSGAFEVVGVTGPYESCRPKDTTITVLQRGGGQ